MFVLGTMAASLDATVTSTPRDGIDIDTDSLPFVGDGVSDVADSYTQGSDSQRTRAVQSGDGQGEGNGDGSERKKAVDSGAAGQSADTSAGQSSSSESAGGGRQQGGRDNADGGAGSGAESGSGATDSPRSLLDWLLLAGLVVIAVLAFVVAAAYVVRRRERLLALLWRLADRYGLVSTTNAGPVAVPGDDGEPATTVERAWAEMLRRSGADCDASDTPRECAAAAMATGVDSEAAEELTSLYERVRYGQRAVATDHASRAMELLREVPRGRRPQA